mgnify:CR=1 FL=1
MADSLEVKELDQVVVRFSGDSGDGMQLAGNIFSTVSATVGNSISTFPDYPADIRAPQGSLTGVSGFQVHIGADLITLCSMLRIPVCMHNVEDERIFRPAAWNAFGMDKEGADFRACQNYGPIYK